jgi:DnaJ-class molecular chaperone
MKMEQSEPAGGAPLERHVRPDDEACECRECDGQGSYDQWKAVAGHYEGGEVFRVQCDHCDGTGKVDDYGNPLSGDRTIYCCFPDCGCDGARLCMAEKGASVGACSLNIERGSLKA